MIGRSDRKGAFPASTAYSPYDVGATVYQALGVDTESEIRDALNRPMRINSGRPIQELLRDI